MSRKILVVEDELFMLRLIQHTLSKAGYELIEARTSEEARTAIEQQKPSLVVGDAKVVGNTISPVSGPKSTPGIPMICMSNEPVVPASSASEKQEVIFTRPFSPMKLVEEVKRLSVDTTTPVSGGSR